MVRYQHRIGTLAGTHPRPSRLHICFRNVQRNRTVASKTSRAAIRSLNRFSGGQRLKNGIVTGILPAFDFDLLDFS